MVGHTGMFFKRAHLQSSKPHFHNCLYPAFLTVPPFLPAMGFLFAATNMSGLKSSANRAVCVDFMVCRHI